jgi:signal transduction histidine kinase
MSATGSERTTDHDDADFEQARRLEFALVRIRWVGVLLGAAVASQPYSSSAASASRAVLAWAYGLLGALAVGNVVIWRLARRFSTLRRLRVLGMAAFSLDIAVIFAIAWAYSYDPRDPAWVAMYILPLEGAIRYRLRGALAVVALTLISETGREFYLAARFSAPEPELLILRWEFNPANIAFRVGMQLVIAMVAGLMAKTLARQAHREREAAALFAEIARRESAARGELAAFNTAILAGVGAEDLDSSLQLMAAAIGRDLGFESFSILLIQGDALMVKGMYGMPFYTDPIPLGSGVTGDVATTGEPVVIADVRGFPGYIEAEPEMRSEMAAPMRIGGEVIGVLDVESRTPGAFDEGALAQLVRLSDQIALVAHSNRLVAQQRETMDRLRELDQMKSEFVAITSHELRTPITAIRGFVRTMVRSRDRMSGDQIAHFMGIIDRQSARLARLTDDLLLVSRIEAGTLRLEPQDIELERFLHEAVESLGPGQATRIRIAAEPRRANAMIDPGRVDQILRNLLENALKFSDPESTVDLRARLEDGALEIAVTDRGVGIEPEALPLIFDRFHQAGEVFTREREGAGLGLYITKRLIEAMDGGIEVDSTPGVGSTFTVVLPVRAFSPAAGDRLPGPLGAG